jgi:penicillin-binding protein 1A
MPSVGHELEDDGRTGLELDHGVEGDTDRDARGARDTRDPRDAPDGTEPSTTKTGQMPRRSSVPVQVEGRLSTGSGRTSKAPSKASRRRKIVRWIKRIALACTLMGCAGVVAFALWIRRIEEQLPSLADLRSRKPPQVTRVLAADGSVLAELYTERRTVVRVQDLPPHVKLAVLAAEDAGFYEHKGLDYLGILRALYVNLRSGGASKQGASTITQQVVKNLLLDPGKRYERKIREALLARRLEQELTKDEILELYLNHIYFGSGRYGIEEAARGYFGKHANEVTIAEAALLAGLPQSPNKINPRVDMEAATRRRAFVLGQLRDKGFIAPAAYDAAIVEPIKLAPVVESVDSLAPEVVDLVRKTIVEAVGEDAARRGGFTVETTIDPKLQLAARNALREATAAYDKRWKLIGPFPPYPADGRDPKTKRKLPPPEKAFAGTPRYGHGDVYVGVVVGHDDAARTLDVDVGDVHGVVKLSPKDRYDPTDLPPSKWAPLGTRLRVALAAPPPGSPTTAAGAPSGSTPPPTPAPAPSGSAGETPAAPAKTPLRLELGPEAALVSIDVRTRHVLAMAGNVEGVVGGLDRSWHAHRQPGSTFKPFVYGAALAAHKITPASLMDATTNDFGNYNPKNSEPFGSAEPIRLREALAASINLVAVRVARDVGPQAVIDYARKAGIVDAKLQPDLAIALGSYEVTPIELATGYTTFAGGGQYEPPTVITRIRSADGQEVKLPGKRAGARAMSEAEAYVVTSLMTSVVDHGTATGAKVLQRPVAGKTGTSNAAKDTWFAGYTTDVVTVAWVGYDDGRPLGPGEFGGRTALPAWVSFMKEATKGKPKGEFPRPPGIVAVQIDPKTGKVAFPGQADAIEEVFLAGTEPSEVANPDEENGDAGTSEGGVSDGGERGEKPEKGDAGSAKGPPIEPIDDPFKPESP